MKVSGPAETAPHTTTTAALLRLQLDGPWRSAAGTLRVRGVAREREAVRVRLRDGCGHAGWGEAIPLPGYSADDAAAAERALLALAGRLGSTGWLEGDAAAAGRAGTTTAVSRLNVFLAAHEDLLSASVSARFALECALLDLLARREDETAAQWLAAGRALQPVLVSLLLPDDDSAVLAAATQALAMGYGVLKLKIARTDRGETAEDRLLEALRDTLDDAADAAQLPALRLRLDANGGLDPAHAARRMAALRRFGVELVEEPVAGMALLDLPPLPLPWAADESLAVPGLADQLLALPPARRPAALVLKPALLGLVRCLELAEAAAAHGVGLIVTHSLDGDLGHAAACALAAALPVAPRPCGLAPHEGLRRPQQARPWLATPTAPGLGIDDGGVAPGAG